jgi:hypothetical protein
MPLCQKSPTRTALKCRGTLHLLPDNCKVGRSQPLPDPLVTRLKSHPTSGVSSYRLQPDLDWPTATTLQPIGGFSLKGSTFVESRSTSSTQWSTTIATLVGAVGTPDRSLWNNCKVADWLSEWTGEQIGRHLNLDINFLFMSGIPKTTDIFK